jgi:hypothetical protein
VLVAPSVKVNATRGRCAVGSEEDAMGGRLFVSPAPGAQMAGTTMVGVCRPSFFTLG